MIYSPCRSPRKKAAKLEAEEGPALDRIATDVEHGRLCAIADHAEPCRWAAGKGPMRALAGLGLSKWDSDGRSQWVTMVHTRGNTDFIFSFLN